MRRWTSIAKATALEMLSEPLSLLVLLAALAIAVGAPAFHYHQFGEASRMARDAGFSALFTCGGVFAAFATIRAFRRDIESGTIEMTLSHPVSRIGYFLSKTLGATLAYLVFAIVIFGVVITIVAGAEIGGVIASKSGDIARVFGPCLAGGVSVIVLPLVIGAMLNRFARCRFVLSAFVSALVMSAVGTVLFSVLFGELAVRMFSVWLALVVFTLVIVSASAAFAVRFKANGAASAIGILALVLLPVVGNYYLTDSLANGGSPSWGYIGIATLAILPAIGVFLMLGAMMIDRWGRE